MIGNMLIKSAEIYLEAESIMKRWRKRRIEEEEEIKKNYGIPNKS